MFGILGKPIQKEFALSDSQFAWLGAIPILNGCLWRLPFGVLADRWAGRRLFIGLFLPPWNSPGATCGRYFPWEIQGLLFVQGARRHP